MIVMNGINQDEVVDLIALTSRLKITLQMLELVNRNDDFHKKYFYDLDKQIDHYKDNAELYSEDRIEKRTTITTRDCKLEFRQSRKWPNIFSKEERMLLHPDGTIGFWYNDRTDIRVGKERMESISLMKQAMLKCLDFEQIQVSAIRGNMRMVS
jgi:molybdenum cofactor biosynthesis enzyme MoaA